ncbi:hypothetical protein C4J81_05555 [Deltaproteobacteria bacterium Smac51]|nr:hypothetical protein C4J81_05555 [Deltaproteobacteria bacterium Smac51]
MSSRPLNESPRGETSEKTGPSGPRRFESNRVQKMTTSRVKVGLPIDSPKGKTRGGLRWAPTEPRRKEAAPRRALNRNRQEAQPSAGPVTAPANISAKPLSFLSARNFFILFAVALITILLVGGMVRSNHMAVAHSYELSELTQHKMDLLEINRQLKTELAQVSSLEHLEKAARSTLGLITPQQGQIVVIE